VDEEFRREHDVAIFLSFTLIDADDHPFAIDISGLQTDSLGNAQPGGIADRQNCSILGDHSKAAIDYHFKTGHTETA
jgi:hypothetical protein